MIAEYWRIFIDAYASYAGYLWHEITHPSIHNYFYWLIGVSLYFFILEWFRPWREQQKLFRKDFWLDFFYMFFNFFLFSLIIYNAASDVVVHFFNDIIKGLTNFDLQAANPLNHWPMWSILLIGFIVRDFVQWWVHRLLHRVPFLWNFHKVHHSVKEMGFAAHLRYHWMETVVYRTIEYIPLALLGIGLYDFFVIHIFTLAWGHYNHSNISLDDAITGGVIGGLIGAAFMYGLFDLPKIVLISEAYGFLGVLIGIVIGSVLFGPFMKYIFNSPEMHIWHHSYELPKGYAYGINFGLTLAVWDYLFGTAQIPHDGKNIKLGFPGVEEFPESFAGQATYGLHK